MPDTQPTATVAGQSIALNVAGYPDIPNRWGSGHIRITGMRLDYGNSRTPNGRQVFVTGLWVRDDGQVTDNPVDRYYDAHDGDMSDWPDWIADLTRQHDPDRPSTLREMEQLVRPHTPPSRPEPHTDAATGLVPRAVRPLDIEHDELMARAEAEHQARTGAEQARKTAEWAAVLLWTADFAEEVAEKLRAHHEFERSNGALDVMTELRRMAAEAQQQPKAEAHPPTSTWKVESPRRDTWESWGTTYEERDWAQERYESAIANASGRPFRLVRATTTYTVEAEHTPKEA